MSGREQFVERLLQHQASSTHPSPPIEELNRYIRDLIALSTLPAIWLGANPHRIAESLLAVIDSTIAPKMCYICLPPTGGEPLLELARLDYRPADPKLTAALGEKIRTWAASHDPE